MATTHLDISPHLLVMTNSELENRLNVNLDTLLSSGRVHIPIDLRQTRIESYQALALLSGRLMNAEGERDASQRERDAVRAERDTAQAERDTVAAERDQVIIDRNSFWIRLTNTRKENDDLLRTRDNLQLHLARIRRERDVTRLANAGLRRERDTTRIQSVGALAQYNLVFDQLGRVNGELVHANNRARNMLATLQNRLFRQIGALRIQVQWFRNRQLNPPAPLINNPPDIVWLQLQ